jgi:hypothetical protein
VHDTGIIGEIHLTLHTTLAAAYVECRRLFGSPGLAEIVIDYVGTDLKSNPSVDSSDTGREADEGVARGASKDQDEMGSGGGGGGGRRKQYEGDTDSTKSRPNLEWE